MDFEEDGGHTSSSLSLSSNINGGTNKINSGTIGKSHGSTQHGHRHNYSAASTIASCDAFERIPEEVWILIFENLDFKSLVRASSVCRQWHRTTNDSHLWKRLCLMYQVAIEWTVKWTKDNDVNIKTVNGNIETVIDHSVKIDDEDEIRYR